MKTIFVAEYSDNDETDAPYTFILRAFSTFELAEEAALEYFGSNTPDAECIEDGDVPYDNEEFTVYEIVVDKTSRGIIDTTHIFNPAYA